MIAAAHDIVRVAETAEFDPLTLAWANDIIAANATRAYRKRGTPAADRLLGIWAETPMAGYTLRELRTLMGDAHNASFQHLLRAQCQKRRIFQAGPHSHRRYFVDEDACNEAAIEFRQQIDDARARAIAPKPLKIPRLGIQRTPRPRDPFNGRPAGEPRPKKPSLPPKPDAVRVPAPPTLLDSGEAFRPAHVQVQVIPTRPDPRYHVEAPATGFLSDWKKLRGEA